MLALFGEGAETAGWIGGAVLALGGIGTFIVSILQGRSKVRMDEFRELIEQQRKTIDRQGVELAGVRVEMATLTAHHDQEMDLLQKSHAECERDKVYQAARIDSLEFALENAKIEYRRAKGPVPPGSGYHRPLPPPPPPASPSEGER